MNDRERYLEHKKTLDEFKERSERQLGKNTLVASSGAFAFSLTLLKDFYLNPIDWTRYVLVSSWVVLGVCAFLTYYSDLLSAKAAKRELDGTDELLEDESKSPNSWSNPYSCWVDVINRIVPWLLAVGLVCMLTFACVNFLNKGTVMSDNSKKTQQSEALRSAVPPKAPPRKPNSGEGCTKPQLETGSGQKKD
jgi:hypothetical protein